MQISRLFEIVYVLLGQKSTTAKVLSERFEVSQRTIYRDIDTLSAAGIPVYTEKGRGGGISLLPGFVLDKSILSEHEQTEILTALRGLSSVSTVETDAVLKKMSAIFGQAATGWLDVDFSSGSNAGGDNFRLFKAAILKRRIAEFDYYGANGEKSHRRAEPVQLWFNRRAWYIKAYCLTRQNIRLFKLTRVKNLIITDEVFKERDLTEIADFFTANQSRYITLKLKIAPEMTYRVYDDFDESQVSKAPDGSFIVMADWPEDEWVYGFVLSFGEYIEVLEPEHIREIILAKSKKIAEKYL